MTQHEDEARNDDEELSSAERAAVDDAVSGGASDVDGADDLTDDLTDDVNPPDDDPDSGPEAEQARRENERPGG